jgi:hypothetical protein
MMQGRKLLQIPRGDWSVPLDSHLQERRLSICWANNRENGNQAASFSLLEMDVDHSTILNRTSFPCPCSALEALRLTYDLSKQQWLLARIEGFQNRVPSRLVLSFIPTANRFLSGSSLLIGEAVDNMTDIGPVLLVDGTNPVASLLYLKPERDDLQSPTVYLTRVRRQGVEEQLVCEAIAEADKALGCFSSEYGLLLACHPEYGELAEAEEGFVGATAQWRMLMMGWKRDTAIADWSYSPPIGLPVGDRASPETDFEWLRVAADAVAGPTLSERERQTFVVAMVLLDTFDYQAHVYTLEDEERIRKNVQLFCCIDTKGEIVQICQSQIGLHVHLCQTAGVVVGVDSLDARRRLWNWFPLMKETVLHTVVELDPEIIRVSVVAGPPEGEYQESSFWLLEEYPDSVKISKRDAITLAELAPAIMLNDTKLLSKQTGWRDLKGDMPSLTVAYRNTLLALGVDKDEQLVLYQI